MIRICAREDARIELRAVGEILEHADVGVHHAHADVARHAHRVGELGVEVGLEVEAGLRLFHAVGAVRRGDVLARAVQRIAQRYRILERTRIDHREAGGQAIHAEV